MNGQYEINNSPIEITDSPRYPYRGLLLDGSRRYYPKEVIKSVLDSMVLAKFNVLHWHMVGDDCFPMYV